MESARAGVERVADRICGGTIATLFTRQQPLQRPVQCNLELFGTIFPSSCRSAPLKPEVIVRITICVLYFS